MNRGAGLAIPHHRRFALIGDADGGDACCAADLLDRFAANLQRRCPNLVGVVLDPTWLRIVLPEFDLRGGFGLEVEIEDDRRALMSCLGRWRGCAGSWLAQKSGEARRSTEDRGDANGSSARLPYAKA
jgi:hypothetical protein